MILVLLNTTFERKIQLNGKKVKASAIGPQLISFSFFPLDDRQRLSRKEKRPSEKQGQGTKRGGACEQAQGSVVTFLCPAEPYQSLGEVGLGASFGCGSGVGPAACNLVGGWVCG